METFDEIVPFAKEMLNQWPSRGMVKIYMIGTTLALFGVVGGLVETVCMPFSDQETTEDGDTLLIMEKKRNKETLQAQTTHINSEVMDIVETTDTEVKAKQLPDNGQRRSSTTRLHA